MALWHWRARFRHRDEDLQEEIRSHLAMAARDRVADGQDREAARLAALKEFGNVMLIEESARQARRGSLVEFLDGIETLGSGTLDASGVATFTTSGLSAWQLGRSL